MGRMKITTAIWAVVLVAFVASGQVSLDGEGVGSVPLGAALVFGLIYWIVNAAVHEASRQPGEKAALGTRHTITGRTRCMWCHKGVRSGASVCHHCGRDQPR